MTPRRASASVVASLALALPLVVSLVGCSSPEVGPHGHPVPPQSSTVKSPPARPICVLETDYGSKDDAPALLRGVMLSIARDAAIVELTQDVPPFDIVTGAQDLEDSPGLFPEGSVFVVVVDPGVGTSRKGIAVELANGRFLVGPDNGVLSLAMQRWGVKGVREITNAHYQIEHHSETFHGRDMFAPCGAHLALGEPFDQVGPEQKDWIKLAFAPAAKLGDGAVEAMVSKIDDPYGNIWTNVEPSLFPGLKVGNKLTFKFADKSATVPVCAAFGEVPDGSPLAYFNSRGRLALALNMGDAAKAYGVKRGDKVTISLEK